jgi:hypothetical protein
VEPADLAGDQSERRIRRRCPREKLTDLRP